jgi:hypothetical protein
MEVVPFRISEVTLAITSKSTGIPACLRRADTHTLIALDTIEGPKQPFADEFGAHTATIILEFDYDPREYASGRADESRKFSG